MSTANYRLTPAAVADLDSIWTHTAATWDQSQAETYLLAIGSALDLLATHPQLGRTCDDVRPGYRRHTCGSHIIFYRLGTDGIDVIRILHVRMDPDRHL